jgi:uncharacterized membrane protein
VKDALIYTMAALGTLLIGALGGAWFMLMYIFYIFADLLK